MGEGGATTSADSNFLNVVITVELYLYDYGYLVVSDPDIFLPNTFYIPPDILIVTSKVVSSSICFTLSKLFPQSKQYQQTVQDIVQGVLELMTQLQGD